MGLPAIAWGRNALDQLVHDKLTLLWPQGDALKICRHWAALQGAQELQLPSGSKVHLALPAFHEPKATAGAGVLSSRVHTTHDSVPQASQVVSDTLSHLDRLEAESIHIMREVVAQAENPVMLYSVGKDSSVMLHLARKAFYPSPPPFPLMHVDTRWKFQAMYDFRDYMAKESGMDLIVHINPEGVDKNINPFDHGSAIHTDVMKTQGLKQALDAHRFDVAFGGARRDEEKSRAKERIFSFRSPDDETIQMKRVRFRTLGCYPLTGAVESSADDLSSIVLELLNSRTSERQGRAIDSDSSGSMEKKKQEGYF